MIKNFETYINEDYFSKLANRKDNNTVRTENLTGFDLYLKNVNWIDMGNSKYLYAQVDFPLSEYNDGKLCSLNEIDAIQKRLPDDISIMTKSNLKWLKQFPQFRSMAGDGVPVTGVSMLCVEDKDYIYFTTSFDRVGSNQSKYLLANANDEIKKHCHFMHVDRYKKNNYSSSLLSAFSTPVYMLPGNYPDNPMYDEPMYIFKLLKKKK